MQLEVERIKTVITLMITNRINNDNPIKQIARLGGEEKVVTLLVMYLMHYKIQSD